MAVALEDVNQLLGKLQDNDDDVRCASIAGFAATCVLSVRCLPSRETWYGKA